MPELAVIWFIVVVAMDGTVIAAWNGVQVRRSVDGGKSWGAPILIAKGFMGGGFTVDEVSGDILDFLDHQTKTRDDWESITKPRMILDDPTGTARIDSASYFRHLDPYPIWEGAKQKFNGIYLPEDMGYKTSLLINPATWDELLRPCFERIGSFVQDHGIRFLMHSDGRIWDLIPRLLEVGVEALNPFDSLRCLLPAIPVGPLAGAGNLRGGLREHVSHQGHRLQRARARPAQTPPPRCLAPGSSGLERGEIKVKD